ncbi:MAG: sulfatase [Cyclobacteriaceae bacterium]
MKVLFFISVFILTLISCQSNEESIGESRPNIVFIIADDVNWNDIGVYGNPNVRTPNIDQLAADGMMFTQAFLTTSSCSPSRTSIITGQYPHNTDAEQLHWPLPESKKTFVKELQNAGYWTGLAGKQHMGPHVEDDFDTLMPIKWNENLEANGVDRRLIGDGSGCDDWVNLLQARDKEKPFFLWLAAFDAHRPYYDENIIEQPHTPEEVILPPYHPDNDSSRKDYRLYYDEITRMDQYIGDVIGELENQGVSDNTVILFITDNGRAFPRDKTTLYEGGIKTPFIVKWPGEITAGVKNQNMVSSVDIAPTFMKIAGLELLKQFEGFDLSGMFTDETASVRDLVYAEDHWHDFEDYTRAVRTRKFKYIRNFYPDLANTPSADVLRDPTWTGMVQEYEAGTLNDAQLACFQVPRQDEELYDVENDPFELKNLALDPEYQSILSDMRGKMSEMRTLTNDSLPAVRTPDDFHRETGLPTIYRIRPRPSKAIVMEALLKGEPMTNPSMKTGVVY